MERRLDRRLVAILHADVVGYSRLMEGAETQTFRELKVLFDTVWLPALQRHAGRLVNTAGDAMLVEFGSAIAAVSCAMALQTTTAERNAGRPPERQVTLRIGLNLGEVIVDGDNIYGDEVNLAARIQALAEPGTVIVSARLREAVEGKVSFAFADLGDRQVKNISKAVRVHRVLPTDGGADVALPAGQEASSPQLASGAVVLPPLQAVPEPLPPTVSAPVSRPSPSPVPAAPVAEVPETRLPPPVGATTRAPGDWRMVGADRAGTPLDLRLRAGLLAQHDGVVFGRLQRYCHLTFDNDSLSRRHARFKLTAGGALTIEDLGSTNGTAVDGHKIEPERPVPLKDGSRVSLGEVNVVISKA
jgi:class 3 adenylate cyclase